MNKEKLIRAIKEVVGDKFTLEQIDAVLDGFKAVVFETLKRGGAIRWTGFLDITTKETKPRKGRNPKTNEEIDIPAGTRPAIKFAGSFKTKLK